MFFQSMAKRLLHRFETFEAVLNPPPLRSDHLVEVSLRGGDVASWMCRHDVARLYSDTIYPVHSGGLFFPHRRAV